MENSNLNYLKNLNSNQKKAVLNLDGPCLIVAGAGSGKTKVLTTKVAHIVKKGKALPNQILCVTFTNKAAKEMKDRVSKILSNQDTGLPWFGTFHSICAKILRKHASAVNLSSNFTIIDQDDQVKLIKNICKAENIDIKEVAPKYVLSAIDKWKNNGLIPAKVIPNKKNFNESGILKIYKIYQQKLLDLNACDFGDLIMHTVIIFEKNKDILSIYSNNFKYMLVDEYQDTNFIQNKWLNLLTHKFKNICCVGDDDQSIYSWRGAEIKNFLNFDQLYKNSKKIKLEQNYRSTQNILSAASGLISNNLGRLGKKLWTDGKDGELVKLNCYKNGKDEAINISDIIIIVGFIMGDQQPTGEQFYLSDYNSDGIVNVNDIIGIIYLILEIPTSHSQNEDITVSSENNSSIMNCTGELRIDRYFLSFSMNAVFPQ